MSKYMFDTEVAKTVGVNAAVLFENIAFWIKKNAASKRHWHDGRYWTYNSVSGFARQFDFLSEGQVRTALEKLRDSGLVVTGYYNKSPYDRTMWYALSDEAAGMAPGPEYADCVDENGEDDWRDRPDGEQQDDRDYRDARRGKSVKCDSQDFPNVLPALTDSKPDGKRAYKPPIAPQGGAPVRQGKEAIPFEEIVGELNAKTGASFKASSKQTRALIRARWSEGFRLDDFKSVVDSKADEWRGDARMSQYLRPMTLFGTKFESYLQSATRAVTTANEYAAYR